MNKGPLPGRLDSHQCLLAVRDVVSKRQELLMAFLQSLQPRQPFVDRDLGHRVTFFQLTTTMASSSSNCQARATATATAM
jgi:hypothetical protein